VPATSRRLERKLEVLVKRTDELEVALEEFKKTTLHGLGLSRRSVPLVDALTEAHAGSARTNLNKALDNMERARRDVRAAMTEVAIEEGASLSELAKALGVSRQLISRLAVRSHPKVE